MVECWAVMGRACLDETFYTDLKGNLGDLPSLYTFLNGPTNRLRLSRVELGDLLGVFGNGGGSTPRVERAVTAAQSVLGLGPLPFAANLELLGVVGLAAIDRRVRLALEGASHPDEATGVTNLTNLLTQNPPYFSVANGVADYRRLNGLFQSMLFCVALDLFELAGWRKPNALGVPKNACRAGFSRDAETITYTHYQQWDVELLVPKELREEASAKL